MTTDASATASTRAQDDREGVGTRDPAGQRLAAGGGRLEPELVLARPSVGARMAHRDAGGGREGDRDLLVAGA